MQRRGKRKLVFQVEKAPPTYPAVSSSTNRIP
jgi:hypothetical protein